MDFPPIHWSQQLSGKSSKLPKVQLLCDHGLSELLCKWLMTCLWPTICSVIVACRLKLLSQSKNWKAHIPARMDLVAHEDTTDVVQFIAGVVIEVKLEGHTTWFFRGLPVGASLGVLFFGQRSGFVSVFTHKLPDFLRGKPGFEPRDSGAALFLTPSGHQQHTGLLGLYWYAGDRH